MPMPLKPDPPHAPCLACGQALIRKRINGRMEDWAVFQKRKYCNRRCMAKGMTQENPSRSALLKRLAHLLKIYCELCGTTTARLTLHHKDRNWRNSDPLNIQTLCSSCHTSLHHAAGEIVPRFAPKRCKFCGRENCKRSVCDSCRTRIRRSGNPLLTKTGRLPSLRPSLGQLP